MGSSLESNLPLEGRDVELAAALDFAAGHSRGVLLTLRANGRPQASNILYALTDGTVRISVTEDRAKTANLRRDPRASLHVTSEDFWHYVVLEATAELSPLATSPGDDTCQELRDQYRKIQGEHPDWDEFDEAMVSQRRLVVRMTPDRAYGALRA